MSRVGKHSIAVPSGVVVDVASGLMRARGSKGDLSLALNDAVAVSVNGAEIIVKPRDETKFARSMWGTTRNLIFNLVEGVHKGFSVTLEITGVGYKASVQGKDLVMQLGYSHDVVYRIPDGVAVRCERPTSVEVSGANRQLVGQVAAKIREFRKPEPYKGKGVRYSNEQIVRKEGKKK